MSDLTRPTPGWYPDPENPARYHRYWDGEQWTVRQLRPVPLEQQPAPPARPPQPGAPLGRGFTVLGQVVGIGLVLVLLTVAGHLVLHVWGVGMIDDAVATGDIGRLERYDSLDRAAVFVLGLLLVVVIGWMVWQYRLAKHVGPDAVRRTPPWHAWSWVIPIGNLWMPFQNVRDLWQHLRPHTGTAWLRVWWASLLLAGLAGRLAASPFEHPSVAAVKTAIRTQAVSDVLYVVAAVLAIRIVRTLTVVAAARSLREVSEAGHARE